MVSKRKKQCPKCGSLEYHHAGTTPILTPLYRCKNCQSVYSLNPKTRPKGYSCPHCGNNYLYNHSNNRFLCVKGKGGCGKSFKITKAVSV